MLKPDFPKKGMGKEKWKERKRRNGKKGCGGIKENNVYKRTKVVWQNRDYLEREKKKEPKVIQRKETKNKEI